MSCGIYKIENNINGKKYIGQSINIEKRWQRHRYTKDDLPIHRALQKYGVDNFSFTILEECPQELLNDREKFWIAYYDTTVDGYNLTVGGEYRITVDKYKAVNQYDLSGKYIQTFDSIADAERATHIAHSAIIRVCQDKRHSAGNCQWRYVTIETPIGQDIVSVADAHSARPIEQYTLEGQKIATYSSIAEARDLNGWSSSAQICLACQGKAKTAYGYLWCYQGNTLVVPKNAGVKEKKVLQFDLQGNLIATYASQKEAGEKTGVSKGNISNCCTGKRQTAGGFIWKFEKK